MKVSLAQIVWGFPMPKMQVISNTGCDTLTVVLNEGKLMDIRVWAGINDETTRTISRDEAIELLPFLKGWLADGQPDHPMICHTERTAKATSYLHENEGEDEADYREVIVKMNIDSFVVLSEGWADYKRIRATKEQLMNDWMPRLVAITKGWSPWQDFVIKGKDDPEKDDVEIELPTVESVQRLINCINTFQRWSLIPITKHWTIDATPTDKLRLHCSSWGYYSGEFTLSRDEATALVPIMEHWIDYPKAPAGAVDEPYPVGSYD